MTPFLSGLRTLLTLGFVLAPVAGAAQTASPPASPPLMPTSGMALLDVPYLTQTEQLCGGAALAMVLRYWGGRDIFPQDFTSLLDPDGRGIRASRLAQAANDLGWRGAAGAGTREELRAHLSRGQPVIAMIEARTGIFHYVVIVGTTRDSVIYHDPARAPFVTASWPDFERRWAVADRWILVVLPLNARPGDLPSAAASPAGTVPGTSGDASVTTPCTPEIDRSIQAALAGQFDEAERGLLAATVSCDNDPAGWRELAGLRLLQRKYTDAIRLAERAVQLAPADQYAWQLLATSRFVQGDAYGALDAWNAIGEPRAGVIEVSGDLRTRRPVIVDLVGLHPRALLTTERLRRSERRLAELPVAAVTGFAFEPRPDGEAAITATVAERTRFPRGLTGWAGVGLRALFQKELQVDVSGAAGDGEVFSPAYRFAPNRPRVLLGIDLPAPGRLPGVLRIETFWERQTYRYSAIGDGPFHEDRRRVSAGLSHWSTSRLLLQGGVSFDHIANGRYISVDGTANTRLFRDRLAVIAAAEYWMPLGAPSSFSSGEIVATWRSSVRSRRPVLTTLAGASGTTPLAPLAIWPGASSGQGRGALLRAHPLLDNGILVGEVLGRRLVFATVQYDHPVWSSPYGAISLVGFLDSARAWRRIPDAPGAPRAQVDVGVGVRLNTPGGNGTVRLDVGYGLRDQSSQLSAGYVLPWGRR